MSTNEFLPTDPPVTPRSIHGESRRQQLLKAAVGPMVSELHCSNGPRKSLKLLLLTRQQWRPFEERDHVFKKILASSDHEHESSILPSVGLDVSASAESLADQS